MLQESTKQTLIEMQTGELTEYYVYTDIAKTVKDPKNKEILERIGREEKAHSEIWKKYTQTEVKPNRRKILWYGLLNRIFGFTFTLKLMEMGEDNAHLVYSSIVSEVPEAKSIAQDEQHHESELIGLLDEERLQYVGSMVLGLNDALVELTGTLAGLSLALQNTKLIALSGLVTGISATLSMMSSEYLSARSDGEEHPFKAASYTGIMYVVAVTLLVLPYLIFDSGHYLYALGTMLVIVVLIIFVFTYYVSVAQDLNFKKRFAEMVTISLSVATVAFIIGLIVKNVLGIEV